jgi:hypothetical protein
MMSHFEAGLILQVASLRSIYPTRKPRGFSEGNDTNIHFLSHFLDFLGTVGPPKAGMSALLVIEAFEGSNQSAAGNSWCSHFAVDPLLWGQFVWDDLHRNGGCPCKITKEKKQIFLALV